MEKILVVEVCEHPYKMLQKKTTTFSDFLDSGGPLQIAIGNECVFSIIGVTSYGSTYCGQKSSPGIYTRVSSYLDWIEVNVWGS